MKTYDPKSVVMTFAGIRITGYADGTFIAAEREEDGFTKVVGAGGEVARAQSRNRSGMVTLTLLGTSDTNDLLSDQYALDEADGTGHGALMVKDANGTTLLSCEQAWIRKLPNYEGAKEVTSREWVFDCADLEYFIGGQIDL